MVFVDSGMTVTIYDRHRNRIVRSGKVGTPSPLNLEQLQAVTGPAGIVLRDVVEPGNLPLAVVIAMDLDRNEPYILGPVEDGGGDSGLPSPSDFFGGSSSAMRP